ncbi:methyltransferase domain-containing protein [Desertimonas flava]|uniref:methyltransferase domain-containing protein n=1 Tax=Desertimonas flava TaxID=2064846 RepID=UPI000E34B74D|nr:methyltransferase domain-containing protein [Desertimonas flava]
MSASEHPDAWRLVDEGWGRRAADFATLAEPSNCREYVAVHRHLDVGAGTRLLDVACGSGLALELARACGATVAGIDASARLLAVARHRNPDADLAVGDMHHLPWDDGAFDVVTSFRGFWGTTPDALTEAWRVLAPAGRLGFTVWGHIKASEGAWALSPFRLASEPKVANQAAMVALGRPGAGEDLLDRTGFVHIRRVTIPMAWEFADPASYARGLASMGPSYEAIQTVGEDAFMEYAHEVASARVRDGLPLRATLDVVGYLADKPAAPPCSPSGFLAVPDTTEELQRSYEHDVETIGFVMNASRAWAHSPDVHDALFGLLDRVARSCSLTFRQRGILVTACASAHGDSYCSLAWGLKLATHSGPDVAAGVLRGDDTELDAKERALATWARRVAGDPNGTVAEDLDDLRAAGYDDAAILAITTFVALRIAYSTINGALGVHPDRELADAPRPVVDAVRWGRPIVQCT